MAESPRRPTPEAQAEQRITEILRAADSWAREAPGALMPAIRAVCIRLAEMVADQRHYLAPLPEPQETERRTVLTLVADKLRSKEVTSGGGRASEGAGGAGAPLHRVLGHGGHGAERVDHHRDPVPRGLRGQAARRRAPDSYWADDVVAGIIASARALIGVDELHARTEARYSGPIKRVAPEEEL